MGKVEDNLRVILIGGSSHTGKSSVAKIMSERLGYSFLSTDSLARHPGRPWRTSAKRKIPEHIVEHYSKLAVEELFDDVLRHYRRVWETVKEIIALYITHPAYERLIIEGSAIWPGFVAGQNYQNVESIWLTAGKSQFQDRIYRESDYEHVSNVEKYLIDKFLKRTQYFNQKMMAEIRQRNMKCIEVSVTQTPMEVAEMCLKMVIL